MNLASVLIEEDRLLIATVIANNADISIGSLHTLLTRKLKWSKLSVLIAKTEPRAAAEFSLKIFFFFFTVTFNNTSFNKYLLIHFHFVKGKHTYTHKHVHT